VLEDGHIDARMYVCMTKGDAQRHSLADMKRGVMIDGYGCNVHALLTSPPPSPLLLFFFVS